MPTYSAQLLQYLDSLVKKTQDEVIAWDALNPSTYGVVVPSANARLILQRTSVSRRAIMTSNGPVMEPVYTYVFQLLEMPNNRIALNISAGLTDPAYAALNTLFVTIEDRGKKLGVDLLRKIIEQ